MKKLKTNLISLGAVATIALISLVKVHAGIGDVPEVEGLGDATLQDAILNVVQIVLGFLGLIALVIVLLGGFKWMTSGGNDDKIGEAKKLMGSGAVGLLIIIAGYAIASFVVTQLVGITDSTVE